MLARRTIARIGGRAAAFLVAAALAAAALTAAAIVPWPEHRTSAPSLVVQPAESRQQRVCPGPLMTLADDAAAATTASSIGSAAIVADAEPAGAVVEQSPVTAPDNPRADSDGTPTVIAAEPGDVAVGLLAGAQSQTAATETVAGFAAAACSEALADAWLVAGATNLGRTSLMLLSNPTEVAATVDVRVSGESGPVEAASALGIIVPPGNQRVLSLAGLAPNLESPVVHVESTGGAIVASLEHSVVQGLAPAGVELSGATAMPSTRQVIPGFVVAKAGGVDPADDHALGDDFPAVRLFAPGDDAVEASIGIVSETGAGGSTIDVTLQPGRVSDVPLGVLAAGSYTLRIEADAPIVAAARATTGVPAESGGADAAASVDLAWTVATAPLLDDGVVVVPQGPSPVLHFASTGTDATETTVTIDGTERAVTVPAGGAASVALAPGAVVRLAGVEGLHASVSFAGAAALASFGVQPPGAQDAPIRVYPR
ncbi:DUF5719 family protein [Agromyces albus]|uniref:DUF5719 family protein n=1 Tax=Agromyces albus TaxID=205332 RepID=UPI00277E18C6|nr:DUF5719 family protein [Agromyces albus]MDQ0574714.1 hypothetical protein [Agromyces albus]